MTTLNPEFFVAQFREEVNDHIQQMTQRLFQLEEQTGDSAQLLEDIFRIVHTLKGSARMMGYTDISAIAHKMEDLLVEIREGHLELDVNAADLLFFCLDTINYLMEGLVKHVKRTANLDDIAALFRDVIAGQPVNVPHLQAQMLTPAATPPAADEPPPGQAPPPSEPLEESEERHYVRIHTGDLDAILNLVGEVLINYYRYEGGRTAYQDMLQDLREHREQIARLQALLRDEPTLSAGTPLRELGETLERSAEQMFHTTKALMKKARTDLQHTHLTMNKLQEQVIDIRMVPAARIFHLLPRFVRMTARRLGKMVELQLIGEETKIDSRIIEEMRDPLIHLIQNALHHGLETPEQRQQRGKPPTGLVIIAANQEANRIAIRIKDDGQGIQAERVREQALKAGLLSHRDLKKISDQELFEVLFHPGFSTSETVDDIAGRGFGLNVVRNHVDRVQGEIEVHSTPGVGTEFVLKLPLTLTILNALFVRVGNEVVAIPTLAIEKTFDLTPDRLERMGALPVVVIDQTLLPVVELGRLLQHGASQGGPPLAFLKPLTSKTVIVIQSEDRRLALIVDDLVEEREIVIKPLGPCLKRVRNVAGATRFSPFRRTAFARERRSAVSRIETAAASRETSDYEADSAHFIG